MKKMYTFVLAIAIAGSVKAQIDPSNFSASISGNYTLYAGDFGHKTPGVKLDIGYCLSEKSRVSLGYTFHSPIKEASTISTSNGSSSKSVASEIKYNFSTISLEFSYTLIGTQEDVFSVYAPVGASYVTAKYTEQMKETPPAGYTAQDQLEPGKESGFTINAAIGLQYRLGMVQVFGEGGIAFPANQTNGQYVENNIPMHFIFNAGVRIPFGSHNSD